MNEEEFKKHLKDLVHGHHHPEEHDWTSGSAGAKTVKSKAPVKKAARVSPRKKTSGSSRKE